MAASSSPAGMSVLSVKKLASVAGGRTQAEFLADFPWPALLIPTLADSTPREGTETGRYEPAFQTSSFRTTSGSRSPLAKDVRDTTRMRHLEASISHLKKTNRNSFAGMITIGRAGNNDIVLPVGSVSKLHGYFLEAPGGKWRFSDSGSSNGTFLRGDRLQPRTPVDLQDGDEIFVGPDVPVIFMTPLGMFTMVKIFSKYAPT